MTGSSKETSSVVGREHKSPQRPWLAWIVGIGLGLGVGLWTGHLFWPSSGLPALSPPVALKPNVLPSAPPPPVIGSGAPLGANTIANIAAATAPSVVNIDTRTEVSITDAPFHFGLPFGEFEFHMGPGIGPGPSPFGEGPMPRKFERNASGSGLIIRADGYILTNNHVVRHAGDINVRLNDKRIFKGHVVGRDSFTDVALVKIDAKDLPVANLGTSKSIRPGDWAIAIGSPLGLDHTVTLGIVSALGRSLTDLHSNVELIQTDAAINPGNSGGPLLNIAGQVIGINTAIRSDAQNIGFAIPIDIAKGVVQELLSKGTIARPYLGVMMQQLDPGLARSLGLPAQAQGVVIAQIVSGGPAAQSTLSLGDVIQRINGKVVRSSKEVQQLVRSSKVGDTLNMLVMRNGVLTAVNVKVGEYPNDEQPED